METNRSLLDDQVTSRVVEAEGGIIDWRANILCYLYRKIALGIFNEFCQFKLAAQKKAPELHFHPVYSMSNIMHSACSLATWCPTRASPWPSPQGWLPSQIPQYTRVCPMPGGVIHGQDVLDLPRGWRCWGWSGSWPSWTKTRSRQWSRARTHLLPRQSHIMSRPNTLGRRTRSREDGHCFFSTLCRSPKDDHATPKSFFPLSSSLCDKTL